MQILDSDFLAWAKTKEPSQSYCWYHPDECPIGQFLEFQGYNSPHVNCQGDWHARDSLDNLLTGFVSPKVARAVKNYDLGEYVATAPNCKDIEAGWTWGQLVKRLENP